MFYFDVYYLILVVPALLISLWAQGYVKTTFAKFSKVPTRRNITGTDAAVYLLKRNSITEIEIRSTPGYLTDNYNPTNRTLNLSQPVYNSTSIAAVGVAAHETGHAIQDNTGYLPLRLRAFLVPVANIGSAAGPWLAVIGIIFSFSILVNIGLWLFAGAVAFYVVTLPVEFNASARAVSNLRDSGLLNEEELSGVKKVLTAAALTYVASALTAIASFLRLFLISRNRRD